MQHPNFLLEKYVLILCFIVLNDVHRLEYSGAVSTKLRFSTWDIRIFVVTVTKFSREFISCIYIRYKDKDHVWLQKFNSFNDIDVIWLLND